MNLAFWSGGAPGPMELIIVLVLILLLFGAKRLPDLARSLGRSLGEFKKGREEGERSEPDDTGDKPDGPKDTQSAG